MNAPRLVLLSFVCVIVHARSGACQGKFPSGRHEYEVRGLFDGGEMDPWQAELAVSDTTIDGAPAIRVTHRSRPGPAGYLFNYMATWKRSDPREMILEWSNNGRQPSACTMRIASGTASASVDSAAPIAALVPREPITDFLLGAHFAVRELAEGDTLSRSVVRCLPGRAGSPIEVKPVVATVRSGTEPRADGAAEPAWLVEGDAQYPFRVWIAKRDRMVLRVVTPQGTVGTSIDRYIRTR